MSITKFTGVTNSIQSLPDRPNQTEGFTPADLKIRFDQFSIDSKAWFNDVMTVEADALLLSANTNATNALNGVIAAQLGDIADGSLTEAKMANEMKKSIVGGVASQGDLITLNNSFTLSLANNVQQFATKMDKTGGTFTGPVTAQSNTSYTVAQMHNTILSTTDAVVGSMNNGDLWIKYI